MRAGAAACALLGGGCLVLGLLHRFDIAIVVSAGSIGIIWSLIILLRGPSSFHSIFFVLMSVSSGFLAVIGAQLTIAAAALSLSLCAWDVCMTAPHLSSYPAHDRRRFVRSYLVRSVSWAGLGFLLVLFSHSPRSDSPSLYALIGLAMLTFVVILFLLWRIRLTFVDDSTDAQQDAD